MTVTRILSGILAATVAAGCASSSAGGVNGARPNAAPAGSTRLGPAPECSGTLAIEVENPSPYEVYATLWMADGTQRNLNRIDTHEVRRFPVPAGATPLAVTAKGRGFDMTRMDGGSPSAQTGGDIKVPAKWVCVATK